MKLSRLKIPVLILGISTALFACTEVIDMKYTTDFERLVVDATILDVDTTQYVKLSKINMESNGDLVLPISNASVVINDGISDYVFTELETELGFYVGPEGFIGEAGRVYKLTITNTGVAGANNVDYYEATAKMPARLLIDSVRADYVRMPQFGMVGHILKCYAWDPVETNYYLFKAWRNGALITDTLYEYAQTDDNIFNGNYINGANCQVLSDRKPDEYVVEGDTLILEIDNIDEAYYNYLNSAQNENRGTNPLFGGSPVNVTCNISNGAVGVYRVYSPSKKATIAKAVDRPEEE